MNTALFYDTETTGLPLFSEPSEDPRQPHMAQVAACLVDLDTRQVHASMDVIVRPDGWTIPDDVVALHGITTEKAAAFGVGELVALNMLIDLWSCAKVRIGHNESFDARIVRIALKRHVPASMAGDADANADAWKNAPAECTQRLATPICALPPTEKMKAARRFHYKSANLQEAYTHFFGAPFDGAHSAMSDVRACMAVYFALQDLKLPQPVAQTQAA